ncbi:cobW-domain-containing protein [Polychaeton citri CBS 116435]|uniref:CobW-domain-containing protein n=1 Tax=Polychaeton citri CBS 116435 TaxID=1314669 RepID=A0A9P4PZ66_9PEZI|nr:cobW-domain-containing protein [Polychaeton citri CBS 116435]
MGSVEPNTRIPITIITGFAGSGKTTLILNLLPQLRARSPDYKLALIKNEIGDLAIDSALAASSSLAGSQELLGDCICCANISQIEDALLNLASDLKPDRIIIETSGSAEPIKLVLEVARVGKAHGGKFFVDGVVSVIDAENWGGYASKSYTAKIQARETDLIVVNKWEGLGEREFDIFLDRLGDLDVETPQVKSEKGIVGVDLLFGLDGKMARGWLENGQAEGHQHKHDHDHSHDHGHAHGHEKGHMGEMECVSVTLSPSASAEPTPVDIAKLSKLLKAAPKDEVYRIKAIVKLNATPQNSDGSETTIATPENGYWILNWSFGRWTWTAAPGKVEGLPSLRMSIFTAQYESTKWTKKIESAGFIGLEGELEQELSVKRVQ